MKLIIGANGIIYEGWRHTEKEELDITDTDQCMKWMMANGQPSHILLEHVIEHIRPCLLSVSIKNLLMLVQRTGRVRIAVPDALHPDPAFLAYWWPPNLTHEAAYDYKSLPEAFLTEGFSVKLIEWWDERREFNRQHWDSFDGHVQRSIRYDHRNVDGKPNFTSLIFDCFKT